MSPRTIFFLASILAPATSACATAVGSSSPGPVGDAQAPKDSGKTDAAVKPPPPSSDAGNPTQDDSGSTIVDDSTCAADSTKAQCEQCCLSVHPSGYAVYHQELLSCACQSPGACATECANEFCVQQPTTTGDACEQCITSSLAQSGACYSGISSTCQADTDCTALFQTCIPPCETK